MLQEAPNSSMIMQIGMGFWPAKTLLSAVELRLFTLLGPQALTAAEISGRLDLRSRAVFDFLDGLVALGLLSREGSGETARYGNTRDTAMFLDEASPDCIGGFLDMANARLFGFWGGLTEALRTGCPQNETKHSGHSMFEEVYADPARLEQFMRAMSGMWTDSFQALAEKFDFSRFGTVCDVGGATGRLSIILAQRHPHLRCLSFDLPVVEPIARRTILNSGVADRVTPISGDFFVDSLPEADVITMGSILHDWNLDRKLHLIRSAHKALPPGGALIAVENIIDDERRENVTGLMMSLNMLIEFGDAFDYTGADYRRWCEDSGFRRVEVIPLAGSASAAIAYK